MNRLVSVIVLAIVLMASCTSKPTKEATEADAIATANFEFTAERTKITKDKLPEFINDWSAYSDSLRHKDDTDMYKPSCLHNDTLSEIILSHILKPDEAHQFTVLPKYVRVRSNSCDVNTTLSSLKANNLPEGGNQWVVIPKLSTPTLYLSNPILGSLHKFTGGQRDYFTGENDNSY